VLGGGGGGSEPGAPLMELIKFKPDGVGVVKFRSPILNSIVCAVPALFVKLTIVSRRFGLAVLVTAIQRYLVTPRRGVCPHFASNFPLFRSERCTMP
jgi:hypothetical protein